MSKQPVKKNKPQIAKNSNGYSFTRSEKEASFTFSLADYKSPSERYYANHAFVTKEGCAYNFIFIQTNPIGIAKSSLVVTYGRQQFLSIRKRLGDFREKIQEFLKKEGMEYDRPDLIPMLSANKEAKHLSMRASIDRFSHFGSDAELDFYYISPAGVRFLNSRVENPEDILIPVVAIATGTEVLASLLEDIYSLTIDEED
jgi:hypothetical protein